MEALVYKGPGQKSLEDRPKPTLKMPADASRGAFPRCAGRFSQPR